MGRLTVKVPDVGEGVAEVELVSWAVAEGQPVERNQIVAEVMTDKATVEVPSPVDGIIGDLAATAGDRLLVGEPLFQLDVEGEGDDEVDADVGGDAGTSSSPTASAPAPAPAGAPDHAKPVTTSATTSAGPASSPVTPSPASIAAARTSYPSAGAPPRPEGRKPTAAPSVRRRARDAGVDLRSVIGTGPADRITHEDLDAFFRQPSGGSGGRGGSVAAPNTTIEDQPIVGLRRRIAEQMVASASSIPHITYVDEVDMTALEELRATLNARAAADNGSQPRLTILPFLVQALVRVLPQFPMCNAHVVDDGGDGPATLRTFGGVHVGIATQT
ncbi:MAG: 2-oxo acid dehydrogenase subunit E2, partial [Actinomycetota bacterium]